MGAHDGDFLGREGETPASVRHHHEIDEHGVYVPPPNPIAKAVKNAKPPKDTATQARLPKGFKLTGNGVVYLEKSTSEEGEPKTRELFVCSPLNVTAETRDKDQTHWGRLLEWPDRDGHPHVWAIPMSMLEGEPAAVCAVLADGGLIIGGGSKVRGLLVRYIKESQPGARARCVNRIGWHGGVYVLPTQTIGQGDGERVIFQSGAAGAGDFRQRGTAAEWRESVAALCHGNSRPMMAIGAALAAPLLHFVPGDDESGGFHFRGGSSCGKSTALWAAASVYGQPKGEDSFRKEWRATSNGLESTAAGRNDSLLILDEMGQVDGKEAGTIAYMLANGQPKQRMKSRDFEKPPAWRLLFLSSGEISLADHMAQAGKRIKAGQENRLADIPAVPFNGHGVFDELNGHPDGAALSVAIREAAERHHGAAGLAFLEAVARHQAGLPERLKSIIGQFVAHVVPKGASGQVGRVAKRFGLVAAALVLAGEFGITGWDQDAAVWAVKACFNDWLHQRGGAGDHEEAQILAHVRLFFESHGESRFTDWDSAERVVNGEDNEHRTVSNRAGFRRKSKLNGYTYYVLPEAFKTELCAGLDHERAARVLKERGWIEPEKSGKTQQKPRLPGFGGTQVRCYVFTSKMWESSDG